MSQINNLAYHVTLKKLSLWPGTGRLSPNNQSMQDHVP